MHSPLHASVEGSRRRWSRRRRRSTGRADRRASGRGHQLQSGRPSDHVRHLLPVPWSRRKLAPRRHAAGPARRGAQATAATARRSFRGNPTRASIVQTHLRRGSRARDASGRHPQGAHRRAEADHPPMDRAGRRVRRAVVVSACAVRPRRSGCALPAIRSTRSCRPGSTREGVKKSPEADRRTLLRRVTLDLTGLAPTASRVGCIPRGPIARRATRRS